MAEPAILTRAIVEALYDEALALAEEARAAFDLSAHRQGGQPALLEEADLTRVALSCEALRTTTRMMHALAWLLNHRAYFAGELSESQLARNGRLPPAQAVSDAAQLALLEPAVAQLVGRTAALYARLARLDREWHDRYRQAGRPAAVHRLHERIGLAFAAR